ncbi:hypothetical protein [Microbacterium sp. NPDC058389]|uniref:hypothetical protein n=1 Tax=Microbacterium sp. NPDC058389 TaxID=3346475 RepID=UPI00365ED450
MFRDHAPTGTALRAAWRRAAACWSSRLARLFERTFLPFAPLDVAVPVLRAQAASTAQPDHEPAPAIAPARLGPPLEWIP